MAFVRVLRFGLLLLPVSLAAACSSSGANDGQAGGETPSDDGGTDAAGDPAPSCDVHAGAAPHFTDKTDDWNLGETGLAITGNRIEAMDLDGDGYPDLLVHAISSNQRETIRSRTALVHALMNRSRPGGGRQFVDATKESGIFQTRDGSTTQYRSAQLAIAGDVDNDGDLDIFSGTYVDPTNPKTDPGDRSEILLNDGTGHFTLAPISDPHPQATDRWPTTSATFTDVDRDGKLDLFVGFWYERYGFSDLGVQAQLYQGNGDGTFTTITDAAGLATDDSGFDAGTNHRPAYGVTSCDLNGDGAPELMVSAYGRQWNLLYQNDGKGRFTEVGQASGYAGDDLRDYSDNQFFACYCTLHASEPDCAGVAKPLVQCPTPADAYWAPGSDDQPWRLNGNTFSTYCGDLDGDGDLDLYSAEIRHWHIGNSSDPSELLRSDGQNGAIHFTRPGNAQTGMSWPHPTSDWNEGGLMVGGADFDADGREDLYVAASDYPDQFGLVFHQKPDHTFEEVGAAWGIHHACASGLAIADFDRDGDLDVVVGSGTARDCSKVWKTNEVHLYENDASQSASWLLVRLVGDGKTANTTGIGARVTVSAGGETIVKELEGGYGHMAMQHDTLLYFGLGACSSVDSITVRWPDQALTTQTFSSVGAKRFVELRQGDATVHDVVLGG
jgi:hypothetical protein